jgi:hypothetical protein
MAMAKRLASTAQPVLPRANSKAGNKTIRSLDELLTKNERKSLRSDLSEMARQRRKAEASSANLRLS